MTNEAYRKGYDAIDWSITVPAPARKVPAPARAAFPCPRVMTDSMPETEHVDGKFYTSKSEFRKVTKENGYVEVGNDTSRITSRAQFRKAQNEYAIERHKKSLAAAGEAVARAAQEAGI